VSELRLNSMRDLLLLAYSPRPTQDCQCRKSNDDCIRPYETQLRLEQYHLENLKTDLGALESRANALQWDRTIIVSQALAELASAAILAIEGVGTLRAIISVRELTTLDWAKFFAMAAGVGDAGLNLSHIADINRELDQLAERAITLQIRMTGALGRLQDIRTEMIEQCFPLRPSAFGPGALVDDFIDDWIGE